VQSLLSMEIIGCLSESGFSLDELVVKTKRLFEQKGMAGFIALSASSPTPLMSHSGNGRKSLAFRRRL